MMNRKNKILLIISLVFLIISLFLIIIDLSFIFMSIGIILSISTHILMVFQNKRFIEINKNEFEKATFHSNKFSLLWLLIRLLITTIITVLSFFIAYKFFDEKMLKIAIFYIIGYMFIKILFIISLLFYKEGDNR